MILPGSQIIPVIRSALERGQRVRLTVNGASMLPFIRDGDLVELEPMNSLPSRGDVVLVQLPDGPYVLHRVVRCERDEFFLRGDFQKCCQGPFTQRDLLGRVILSYHKGRGRSLGTGVWHLAGLFWIRCHPVGVWLLPIGLRIRRFGTKYLSAVSRASRRVAGLLLRSTLRSRAVRLFLKRLKFEYVVQEACLPDLIAVNAWLDPGADREPGPSNPSVTNYVAKRGRRVIGLVRLGRHDGANSWYPGYWLWSLIVRAPYRGLGIGEALTHRVIERARAEGAQELFLAVFEDSVPAVTLYRKLGFERVVLPNVEEELEAEWRQSGRRRVSMRKILDSGESKAGQVN